MLMRNHVRPEYVTIDAARVYSLLKLRCADVNGGQKILIRLRPHYDASVFMAEEELLGTMLHEVRTHPVCGVKSVRGLITMHF